MQRLARAGRCPSAACSHSQAPPLLFRLVGLRWLRTGAGARRRRSKGPVLLSHRPRQHGPVPAPAGQQGQGGARAWWRKAGERRASGGGRRGQQRQVALAALRSHGHPLQRPGSARGPWGAAHLLDLGRRATGFTGGPLPGCSDLPGAVPAVRGSRGSRGAAGEWRGRGPLKRGLQGTAAACLSSLVACALRLDDGGGACLSGLPPLPLCARHLPAASVPAVARGGTPRSRLLLQTQRTPHGVLQSSSSSPGLHPGHPPPSACGVRLRPAWKHGGRWPAGNAASRPPPALLHKPAARVRCCGRSVRGAAGQVHEAQAAHT